ncbi:MAG TPA: hypothetical protein ACFYEE_08205 [Candidatus Wujingus californicus]|uniref:hypothetical protein n=1 Tax=Candidatus Wujingus californicus TaxID=3367618 RepID=UPI00402645B4
MVKDYKSKISLLFDEVFPERVLKTSVLLSLIMIASSLSYMSFVLTTSLAIGCFISIALFKTTWWTIRHAAQNNKSKIKGFFLKISLLKYFIIGSMLLSACFFLEINIVAMSLGLGMVVAVIVLKVGGTALVNFMNKSVKMPSRK